jgi:hypothetical protein
MFLQESPYKCKEDNPPLWLTISLLLIGIGFLVSVVNTPDVKDSFTETETIIKGGFSLLFISLSGMCHAITR